MAFEEKMKQIWSCDTNCDEVSGIRAAPSLMKKESCPKEQTRCTELQEMISGDVILTASVLTAKRSCNKMKYDPTVFGVFM